VLPTERLAHLCGAGDLLRCGILVRLMTASGQILPPCSAPACPLPLNANIAMSCRPRRPKRRASATGRCVRRAGSDNGRGLCAFSGAPSAHARGPAEPMKHRIGAAGCSRFPRPNPPAGKNWIHEIKLDGFRMLARRHGAGVRLLTRRGSRTSRLFWHVSQHWSHDRAISAMAVSTGLGQSRASISARVKKAGSVQS
jgi:hypothetical protein